MKIAKTIDSGSYLMGILIGAGSGLLSGALVYLGIVRYASKYLFKISSILLILIAAGFTAKAIGILSSTFELPLTNQIWDSSWIVENKSIVGKILGSLIGYEARPNILQIFIYILVVILNFLLLKKRKIK
jgi:high-affinity iron transporter